MAARILSVNPTEPRTILLRGKEVATSIYKRPAPGPIAVDEAGLVGEGERRITRRLCDDADHALYFYPREHYAVWQRELEEGDLPGGYFGENLTCEGLLEEEVRIGDVLRCGSVTVQVRQPRLPCAKLDVRTSRRFVGRFLRSRRVGFFARVLSAGQLAAGDSIELLHRDPAEPTIDDLFRLTQLDAWDVAGLADLLGSRQLPAPWREIVEHKLELARGTPGWHGLRPLEVLERARESEGVLSLWLACPYQRPLPSFRPGQHLTVSWRPSHDEGALRRAYSLTGDPERVDRYRITVARAATTAGHPPGVVSTALFDELRPGARLLAAAPRGSFTLDEVGAQSRGLLVISEGIGIASALPLLREHSRRLPGVPVAHLHVDRDAARVPLMQELAAVAAACEAAGGTARRLLALRAPAPHDRCDLRGPPSPELVRELAAAAEHVFLIGTRPFTEELAAGLQALEAAPRATAPLRLRVESYG